MISLAATSVSKVVTHPSINWAQSCLTSVIGPWMITPCQQGSINRNKVVQYIHLSWTFRDDLGMINGMATEGKGIIITASQQQQALFPTPLQPKGIDKTRLLAGGSIYWINMNVDIENIVKHCSTCL